MTRLKERELTQIEELKDSLKKKFGSSVGCGEDENSEYWVIYCFEADFFNHWQAIKNFIKEIKEIVSQAGWAIVREGIWLEPEANYYMAYVRQSITES